MKKVLIGILIVLLIILAYFTIANGLSLGNLKILGVKQIIEQDKKLTDDIEAVNSLLKKEYPSKKASLDTSLTELLGKKEEYFTVAKLSTEGQITKANTEETYLREYLWVRVGTHATSEGVKIRMDVNSGNTGDENVKNLAFTVQGTYISIIQFISDLENDDKLNFKIENFKMTKSGIDLTATFNVRNIRIKAESVTATTGTSSNNVINTQQSINTTSTTKDNISQ